MKQVKQVKQSELKDIRKKLLEENNYKCSICGRKINDNAVVDHIHGSHKSIYPETNKLIRNVLCSDCNILLGKLENQYLRSSKNYKEQVSLVDFLKGAIEYIEYYSDINNYKEKLIHPTEWKPKKIKKLSFNKLKKLVKEKYKKNIEYPKSGKLTKEIEKYCKLLDFEIEFY